MNRPFRASLVVTVAMLLVTMAFSNCAKVSNDPAAGSNNNGNNVATCLSALGTNTEWSGETEVPLDGYTAHSMEPKPSSDEVVLFWNDKPATGDSDMNIQYAVKQSNGRYQYIGTLPGSVDASHLDGVPSIDSSGNFYFISTRNYSSNFQTIFGGQINVLGPNSLSVSSVVSADATVTAGQLGTLDMDVDVSWDGTMMVSSRAIFTGNSIPDSSKLILFGISSRSASAISNSDTLLANVNLTNCRVYAGNLSSDKKELYYTVLPTNSVSSSDFRIVVSKRSEVTEAFGAGSVISGITVNQSEAPSISTDGKTLYYHRLDSASGRFKIYKVNRP